MTIRKGERWGRPAPLPPDGIVARTDAGVSEAVSRARIRSQPPPTIGLLGGDLARTCGATGDRARLEGPDAHTLPIDVGEALVDGVVRHFVAHLVIRHRSWWRGRVVAVMNAQHLGPWNVAPRSHPNDGRLDVVEGDPPIGERAKIRSRLTTGTHLPHPAIAVRSTRAEQFDVEPGARVWVDGRLLGPARAVSVRVVPDAIDVVV